MLVLKRIAVEDRRFCQTMFAKETDKFIQFANKIEDAIQGRILAGERRK
jgi:hypothetical protein